MLQVSWQEVRGAHSCCAPRTVSPARDSCDCKGVARPPTRPASLRPPAGRRTVEGPLVVTSYADLGRRARLCAKALLDLGCR